MNMHCHSPFECELQELQTPKLKLQQLQTPKLAIRQTTVHYLVSDCPQLLLLV